MNNEAVEKRLESDTDLMKIIIWPKLLSFEIALSFISMNESNKFNLVLYFHRINFLREIRMTRLCKLAIYVHP